MKVSYAYNKVRDGKGGEREGAVQEGDLKRRDNDRGRGGERQTETETERDRNRDRQKQTDRDRQTV